MEEWEEEVEVELSLGLGIGGGSLRRESTKSLRPGSVVVEKGSGGGLLGCDSVMEATADRFGGWIVNGAGRTEEVVGEAALRRLEARKKQQVRRGVSRSGSGGDRQAPKSDAGVVHVYDDDGKRVQKRTRTDFSSGAAIEGENGDTVRKGYGLDLNKSDPAGSELVQRYPMQYFPYVNRQPHLASGAGELRSGGGHVSFRPFQAAEKKGYTMQNRNEDEKEDGAVVRVGSCCSSAISENSRICSQGGSLSSSDCGSLSSQVKAPRHNAQAVSTIGEKGPNEQIPSGGWSARLVSVNSPVAAAMADLSGGNVTRRPMMVSKRGTERNGLPFISLAQMPRVSTTGYGGVTVKGFLYRYTREEVCIVCVCHGYSFSPAKFVEHAGGGDVENPLRHITVIPSAPTTKF